MDVARSRVGSLVNKHSSGPTLLLVAVVASVLFALLGFVLVAQRDGAHIININGAQRMRVQRIAYLTLEGRFPSPSPRWREEMRATIDDMLRVRSELLARRDLLPTPPDALGNTEAGRAIGSYAEAARAYLRNPADPVAFAYIRANRLPLLAIADATVTARTHIIEARNTQLIIGLFGGLAVMLLIIGVAWIRIIAPTEGRTMDLVAKLGVNEAQMRSLFRENPDAIAMYDADGRVVRGNGSSRALLGPGSEEFAGIHLLEHVAPAERNAMKLAFARALAGESLKFDTTFLSTSGERIDVGATLFPHVVNGSTVGVIGVAKDLRALRRAETEAFLQAERIGELCRVTALHSLSSKRQIEEILAVTAQRLGYDWGAAAEIVGGRLRTIAFVGDAGIENDDLSFVDERAVRRLSRATGAWSIDRVDRTRVGASNLGESLACSALVGCPLANGGARVGSLVLGSRRARATPLEPTDLDFLGLVSTIVGASIERGKRDDELDTLAYFDALTGLPNRMLLADRIAKVLDTVAAKPLRFAIHCLDLDKFKFVNDTLGHACGDDVLRIASQRMTQCVRASDTVARVGGDEFVILQILDETGRGAREVADRVLTAIALPFHVGSRACDIGISIGTSVYPDDGQDATTLLAAADAALLRAKRAGRNRQIFSAA